MFILRQAQDEIKKTKINEFIYRRYKKTLQKRLGFN